MEFDVNTFAQPGNPHQDKQFGIEADLKKIQYHIILRVRSFKEALFHPVYLYVFRGALRFSNTFL
jgi:hypothetical protein